MSGSTFDADRTAARNLLSSGIAAAKAAHGSFNKTGSNAAWMNLEGQFLWFPSGSSSNMTAAQNDQFKALFLSQLQAVYTAAINLSAANNGIAPSY
jgi:hypothetical protein